MADEIKSATLPSPKGKRTELRDIKWYLSAPMSFRDYVVGKLYSIGGYSKKTNADPSLMAWKNKMEQKNGKAATNFWLDS